MEVGVTFRRQEPHGNKRSLSPSKFDPMSFFIFSFPSREIIYLSFYLLPSIILYLGLKSSPILVFNFWVVPAL